MAPSIHVDAQVLDSMEDSQAYIDGGMGGEQAVEIHSQLLKKFEIDENGLETRAEVEKHRLILRRQPELVLHQDAAHDTVKVEPEHQAKAAADHERTHVSKASPDHAPRLRRMSAAEFNCFEGEGVDAEQRACLSTQANAVGQSRKRKASPE